MCVCGGGGGGKGLTLSLYNNSKSNFLTSRSSRHYHFMSMIDYCDERPVH